MDKILLSYDEQESSQRALTFALTHARAFNARLDIVTVVVRESTDQHEDIEKSEKLLETAKKTCEREGIQCRTKLLIRAATPGEALVEYARSESYDEIVIGIKRTSKLSKMLLGSNAQHVILNAHCPVLSISKYV